MPKETRKFTNLDAGESIFFGRQLEHVKAKTYDIRYPNLKARSLIPVSSEVDPGAETIKYESFDQVGIAKIIANYGSDLPRSDIKGTEVISPVRSIGASFGYTVQEVRAAKMAGKPLQTRKAAAAKRSVMQLENSIGFLGDASHGLVGFLNNANMGEMVLPADGTGASKLFSTKTADFILRDLNSIVTKVVTQSLGVEAPNTLLLPLSLFNTLSTQRIADTETTILKFFLGQSPHITAVDWLNELETAGAGSTTRIIAYDRSPEKLELNVPQDFEQFPPQEKGLEFEVPCHSRIGGVSYYYPLSAAFADGA